MRARDRDFTNFVLWLRHRPLLHIHLLTALSVPLQLVTDIASAYWLVTTSYL